MAFLTALNLVVVLIVEKYLEDPQSGILDLITQLLHPPESKLASVPTRDISFLSTPLSAVPSNLPGRSCYHDLVRTCWDNADLDQLHKLFDRVHTMLNSNPPEQRKVTPASPIGLFLRRSSIEWTRLQFADSVAILKSYQAYIAPTYSLWVKMDPVAAATFAETPSSLFRPLSATSATAAPLTSVAEVNVALSLSIHHLQKLGQRLPHTLKSNIYEWLQVQRESSTQSLFHFMSFFEAWRAGQYTLALENLHRYFDYSLATKGMAGSESAKVYYQYALLHLSVLHADFERWRESVAAMEECVATARENQDTACLSFALSWLLYLRQAHNMKDSSSLHTLASLAGEGGGEQDELGFLKAKAKDSKHWSLVSSTLIEESKLELRQTGASPKALEHVFQSAYLALNHVSYSLMPASTTFLGSIYERLGMPHTANRLHAIPSISYSPHVSLGDSVRAQSRSAYAQAHAGQYDLALDLLSDLQTKVRGTLKLEQRVSAFSLLVSLVRSIRRDDISSARTCLVRLLPLRSSTDPEIALQTDLLSIDLDIKQHNLSAALQHTNELLAQSKSQLQVSDLATTLHLLALKATIFSLANSPRKAFTLALRAASTAERANLFPCYLEALATILDVLNHLTSFNAARDLAVAALPQVRDPPDSTPAIRNSVLTIIQLQNSTRPHLLPRFMTALASSYAGLANPAVTPEHCDREAHLRSSLTWAHRAEEGYRLLEDRSGQETALWMQWRLARKLDLVNVVTEAEEKIDVLAREHDRTELAP